MKLCLGYSERIVSSELTAKSPKTFRI
jgi:hypothetical protein